MTSRSFLTTSRKTPRFDISISDARSTARAGSRHGSRTIERIAKKVPKDASGRTRAAAQTQREFGIGHGRKLEIGGGRDHVVANPALRSQRDRDAAAYSGPQPAERTARGGDPVWALGCLQRRHCRGPEAAG